jgi:hypothetical protein
MSIEVTPGDDGWRAIDEHSPRDGYCELASEDKTFIWASPSGVEFKAVADVEAKWWRP